MSAHPVPFIIALLVCLCFTTRCDGERFCTLNTIMAMKAPLLIIIIIVVNKRASAMKKIVIMIIIMTDDESYLEDIYEQISIKRRKKNQRGKSFPLLYSYMQGSNYVCIL